MEKMQIETIFLNWCNDNLSEAAAAQADTISSPLLRTNSGIQISCTFG